MSSEMDCILKGLQKELDTLIRLKLGWDGYSGVPVSQELADAAYKHASYLLGMNMPANKVGCTTGNGLTVTLVFHCGAVTVFYDIDITDLELDGYEVGVMVRSYVKNVPVFIGLDAHTWDELIGKIAELK